MFRKNSIMFLMPKTNVHESKVYNILGHSRSAVCGKMNATSDSRHPFRSRRPVRHGASIGPIIAPENKSYIIV